MQRARTPVGDFILHNRRTRNPAKFLTVWRLADGVMAGIKATQGIECPRGYTASSHESLKAAEVAKSHGRLLMILVGIFPLEEISDVPIPTGHHS